MNAAVLQEPCKRRGTGMRGPEHKSQVGLKGPEERRKSRSWRWRRTGGGGVAGPPGFLWITCSKINFGCCPERWARQQTMTGAIYWSLP